MINLTNEKVLELHRLISDETGGSPELRDIRLLDSAVSSAYATFDGIELYPTVHEKAARLGFALVSNHPFVDGNKRIGIFAMLIYLEINGCRVTASNDDVIRAGLSVADGSMKYDGLLEWVRKFTA